MPRWAAGRRRGVVRRRVRRAGASLLAGAAGWVAVATLLPAPIVIGVPAVVASRDLPAGHRLVAADLVVRQVDPAMVPAAPLPAADSLIGRTVTGPVGAGELVTASRVLGPGVLAGRPSGEVAVGVALADPTMLAVLRPGDRVRLLAAGTGAIVVETALVLGRAGGGADGSTSTLGAGEGLGLGGAGGAGVVLSGAGLSGAGLSGAGLSGAGLSGAEARLVVAVPTAQAAAVAAAVGPSGLGGGLIVAVLP
ncbi:MAG TPA: SAF domain-containing protein [Dermatophilaceae bacterium]|nr:SAF domain-containing protein [Dermatophilaceae bacterium]